MNSKQRILTSALWALLVTVMLGVVGTGLWAQWQPQAQESEQPAGLPILYAAPSFSLTDQNNQIVTDASLRGKVWVAAFVFTRCAGPCPMMGAKMAQLQDAVTDPDVKLVSFTVDPEHDKPEVLKEYGKTLGADDARWFFLTGKQAEIYDVANGMLLTAIPADAQNPIIHSSKFLLVDKQGQVRGVYDSTEPEDLTQLEMDAATLAR